MTAFRQERVSIGNTDTKTFRNFILKDTTTILYYNAKLLRCYDDKTKRQYDTTSLSICDNMNLRRYNATTLRCWHDMVHWRCNSRTTPRTTLLLRFLIFNTIRCFENLKWWCTNIKTMCCLFSKDKIQVKRLA